MAKIDWKTVLGAATTARGYLLERQLPAPLTDDVLFSSKNDLADYIKNSATKYDGQIVAISDIVKGDGTTIVKAATAADKGLYVIKFNSTTKEWSYEAIGADISAEVAKLKDHIVTLDTNTNKFMTAQRSWYIMAEN
jgi:hypothetical protein